VPLAVMVLLLPVLLVTTATAAVQILDTTTFDLAAAERHSLLQY